jgi:hypothetical protein
MTENLNHITIDGQEIPVINLGLTSTTVTCSIRKIKARWTPEITQDLEYLIAYDDEDTILYRQMMEREIIKRRRLKDRRKYIKLIEEWTGEKVNLPTEK